MYDYLPDTFDNMIRVMNNLANNYLYLWTLIEILIPQVTLSVIRQGTIDFLLLYKMRWYDYSFKIFY